MDRTDKQRYYTWSILYTDLIDSGVDEKNDKEMEKFISEKLSQYSSIGWIRRMIIMIKVVRKYKMRFLLISDRLFLIHLVYEIFSLYEIFWLPRFVLIIFISKLIWLLDPRYMIFNPMKQIGLISSMISILIYSMISLWYLR